MAIGQVIPASTWASMMKLAARATCAPGCASAHGAPASRVPTASSISACQAGWNCELVDARRRPGRSARCCGGCSLARKPSSIVSRAARISPSSRRGVLELAGALAAQAFEQRAVAVEQVVAGACRRQLGGAGGAPVERHEPIRALARRGQGEFPPNEAG